MPELNPALVELNRRNRKFWEAQNELTEALIADEEILASALEVLTFEQLRHVPVYFQVPFEYALLEADKAKKRFLKQRSRKGGKAKKTDALQELIVGIVRRRPNITERQLLELFQQCPAPIEVIDRDFISFRFHDGRPAEAPVSGLKHRLSRAKKSLNSR
jgi:hypothetical protein